MKIASRQNPTIKAVSKLHQKKYRNTKNQFILEGYHLYEEAKKHQAIDHVYTTDERITGKDVTYVTPSVLEKLANTKHPQGVVTVCNKLPSNPPVNRVLLCDHVQDPGNLGTLIRSALAFSFDTVVLDTCVDLYNDKVLRSTQGALFGINIIEMPIEQFMMEYADFYTIGTALSNDRLSDIVGHSKMGVIVGNEGSGIKQSILEKTSINVTIPIDHIDSLNVGVAGSILMHHIKNNT